VQNNEEEEFPEQYDPIGHKIPSGEVDPGGQ
jgi:hypothetical protein